MRLGNNADGLRRLHHGRRRRQRCAAASAYRWRVNRERRSDAPPELTIDRTGPVPQQPNRGCEKFNRSGGRPLVVRMARRRVLLMQGD